MLRRSLWITAAAAAAAAAVAVSLLDLSVLERNWWLTLLLNLAVLVSLLVFTRGHKWARMASTWAGDPIQRAICRAVKKGLLMLSAPDVMRQGRKERVEVAIGRLKELRYELLADIRVEHPTVVEEEVTTSYVMEVELLGEAYSITALSPTRQLVAPTARWEFDVRPQRAGFHTLILVGRCLVSVREIGEHNIALPAVEKHTVVRADLTYGTQQLISTHWQWIVGTVIAFIGVVGAWLALFQ